MGKSVRGEKESESVFSPFSTAVGRKDNKKRTRRR